MAPNGPDCWPSSDSLQQWLVFYQLDDMTLTGNGTIEGNGEQWWDLPCKPHKVICAIPMWGRCIFFPYYGLCAFVAAPLSTSTKVGEKCHYWAINLNQELIEPKWNNEEEENGH